MFGLLAGLLGGAARGGMMRGGMMRGGLMKGLGGRGSSGQGLGKSYGGKAPQVVQEAPQPEEQGESPQPPRTQEAPPQQPPERPLAGLADNEVAQGQPKQVNQVQQQSPVKGLLDETKPSAEPPPAAADRPPQPPSIENRTETASPVAPQQDQVLGSIPQLNQTDTLSNRLFDSANNRQVTPFQEGMPDQNVDTSSASQPSLGMQFMQSTTVAGSAPGRRYRTF
jgi:hypothetical protein